MNGDSELRTTNGNNPRFKRRIFVLPINLLAEEKREPEHGNYYGEYKRGVEQERGERFDASR